MTIFHKAAHNNTSFSTTKNTKSTKKYYFKKTFVPFVFFVVEKEFSWNGCSPAIIPPLSP